jgi:sarcosine oxidase gamma subunit
MTQGNNSNHMTVAAAGIDVSLRSSPLAGRWPLAASLPRAEANMVLDCTRTERFGLRGPGTLDWLASVGLSVPDALNTAQLLACKTAILRLGQQEVLLTAPPGQCGARLRELRAAWQDSSLEAKGYDAYREEGWAWFLISGAAAERLMPRISMADLRPQSLKVGQVSQTRALHQDAVVVRLDRFGTLSYEVFLDMASAEFALEVLQDTAEGIDAYFAFAELALER